MKLAIALGTPYSDVEPHSPSWDTLCRNLSQAHTGSKDGRGWMPADIDAGQRKGDRVRSISVLVLDIEARCTTGADDQKQPVGPEPPSVDAMVERLGQSGYSSHLHTTHGHTPEHPRYRLVFEISRQLLPNELRNFGEAVAMRLGLSDCYDRGALEPARLYYLPRCPVERIGLFRAVTVVGAPIDVDSVLVNARNVLAQSQAPIGPCPTTANILKFPQPETPEAISKVISQLTYIDANCDYEKWRNVIWSVLSTRWCCAENLARQWSMTAPQRFSESAFRTLVDSFDPAKQSFSLGTVVQCARDGGWKPEATARFKFLTARELDVLPELTWVVKGLLPAQGLAAIYGPSGSGKSFLALDLMASIVLGQPFYGRKVSQRPVVYCALEGRGGIKNRLAAWRQHHGQELPDSFRALSENWSLLNQGDVRSLADAVNAAGLSGGVLVIDTLNQAAPGMDENSSQDMSNAIHNAMLVQQMTGGLIVLVHHTGKDLSRGMRGHSSLHAALDAAICVTNAEAGRHWELAKSKDSDDGSQHQFQLKQIELGRDSDGDPVTSCVAVPDLFRAVTPARPKGKNQKLVLAALQQKAVAGRIGKEQAFQIATEALPVSKNQKARVQESIEGLIANGNLIPDGGTFRFL